MPEQQLSIRSTRARRLAHKLAKQEQRTVSQIVEKALEAYAARPEASIKETEAEFWTRINRDYATDIDLQAVIDENRKLGKPVEL